MSRATPNYFWRAGLLANVLARDSFVMVGLTLGCSIPRSRQTRVKLGGIYVGGIRRRKFSRGIATSARTNDDGVSIGHRLDGFCRTEGGEVKDRIGVESSADSQVVGWTSSRNGTELAPEHRVPKTHPNPT